jgi:type I restriction enzyme, S subunit
MKKESLSKNICVSAGETKNEETRRALVPRLRFPEFRGADVWTSVLMGDVYSFKSNNSLSRDKLNYVTGSVKNIHYGDIHTKFSSHFDIRKEYVPFINESEEGVVRDEHLCAEGDMIFADASEDMADIGKSIEVVNLNGVLVVSGLHTILARRSEDRIVLGFGGHLFKSGWVRTQIQKEAQGAKVLGISANRIRNIRLPVPNSKAEQQKIAECLSSLDELIAAQARKVDALKTHKKGLMQQLFPREGETQPRLRFPEFRDAGEWASKVGGELFTNRKEKGEEYLPIYSVTVNDGMVPRASFDRNFYDIEDPAGNRKVHKGDIAYNMMRMWQGAQGVASEDCLVSPAYVVLKPRGGVCSNFFAYFFKLPQSLHLLTVTSRGLTKDRLRLYFDDFAKMPLCIPDKAEQQRIAECLSSLDALIATETKKIEALKTHKKGLMQQVFPSPENIEA